MADKDEEQPTRSFKVADRRRFVDTDSGDASREDAAPEPERDERATPASEHTHAPTAGEASAAYDASSADVHAGHGDMPGEMSFSTFVIGLTTQALMHLGEIADPMQQQAGADLPAAKQMIDLLGILRDKTKGNLDDAETQLLENMLYDLRLRYVEVSRSS
jgi:hypothetical protein